MTKRSRRKPEPAPEPKRGGNRRIRPKAAPAEPAEPKPKLGERLGSVRLRVTAFLERLRRPAELTLRALVVVAIGAGAVALGRLVERHVRTSAAFEVTSIDLEGHVRLSREEVLARAGLALGANVFDVAPEDAEAALLEHPWIEEASVTRRLPGSYTIEVRERRPVALLALGDVFLVSENGAVFKAVEDDDPIDLPVITGIERERFTHDRVYRTSILLEAVALLHDYRGAGLARREPIGEVHVERDDGLSLYIGGDATYVRLGHGPFREKLGRLRTVLDELGGRGARAEYVYLDNERRPDRVTVRVRDVLDPEVEAAAIAQAPQTGG
ncbi:MAG: FtsQ-type POTRA domain-containing protein [Sandaracinaceae bacterium]|nr:FtsQ-type POTRA domain-containing protein [Sandaracinaceae bacterium]